MYGGMQLLLFLGLSFSVPQLYSSTAVRTTLCSVSLARARDCLDQNVDR